MACWNSRAMRVQDESELESLATIYGGMNREAQKKAKSKVIEKTGRCFDAKVLSRVFPEDYEKVRRSVLDPRGQAVGLWNKVFFVAGLVSLFIDPLFFFLPVTEPEMCFTSDLSLQVTLTIIRSVTDVFYIIHIVVQFRTAYVAPSSRVLGRGELVIDPWKIAYRYLVKDFWVHLMAALPLPQVLVWVIIPNLDDSATSHTLIVLRFTVMLQYLLRFSLIYPLSSQIVNATGVLTTETAWVGAAYNMMLYLLASHVAGTCFYLLTVERQQECWKSVCQQETLCEYGFFDCRSVDDPGRSHWLNSTNVTNLCVPSNTNTYYQFGIYGIALSNGATSSSFFQKLFYCLWIGIQALSSTGQTLTTSIFTGENIYSILVASLGLVLLALLIANMQRYLASVTARIEEWRLKRTDTEQWMHHRQLPHDLRQSVREYGQFKWVATQGADEESLLNSLPADIHREIKCHLCLNLVRRVPLFNQMDDQMLDAICERLKPSLCTKDTLLLLEGDPVDEMVFIIRGHLDSYTTNGGRTGFFNSTRLGPGDFCGEELLTWALEQHHSDILPSSTCTVQAISEVEAFALTAEDLNFVASQFRRLHSKELVHKFRFYSHQWRTWAACYIQEAWRRYKRQKKLHELDTKVSHSRNISEEMELFAPKPGSGMDVYASRLLGLRRGKSKHFEFGSTSSNLSPSKEPAEQEFIVDEE